MFICNAYTYNKIYCHHTGIVLSVELHLNPQNSVTSAFLR